LELFNFFYETFNMETNRKVTESFWDYIFNIMGVYPPYFPNLSSDDNLIIQKEWLKKIKYIRLKDMMNTEYESIIFKFKDMKIDIDMYNFNKHLHSNEHNTFKKMYLSELSGTIEANKEIIETIFKEVIDNKARQNYIAIPTESTINIQPVLNLIYYSFKKETMKLHLPSIDINAMLHAKLRWNKTQKYKSGDFDDIGHAKSALPYYDYFFTERNLRNMIEESKYDQKYSCEVYSKNSDILFLLKKIFI